MASYVLVVFILQENKEEVDDISYTLKEINAIGGKNNYNVVAICIPDNMHIVKAAWEKLLTDLSASSWQIKATPIEVIKLIVH